LAQGQRSQHLIWKNAKQGERVKKALQPNQSSNKSFSQKHRQGKGDLGEGDLRKRKQEGLKNDLQVPEVNKEEGKSSI